MGGTNLVVGLRNLYPRAVYKPDTKHHSRQLAQKVVILGEWKKKRCENGREKFRIEGYNKGESTI